MKMRLIDLLSSMVDEKVAEEIAEMQSKQESLKKPEESVELKAVYEECEAYQKTEKDKTDDLIELETGLASDSLKDLIGYKDDNDSEWYLVFDTNTKYSYLAKDLVCLNKNFVYRGDVEITTCKTVDEVIDKYMETSGKYQQGCIPRFCCYILDNPSIEKYEVYYDSNYPKMQYGLATPKGCAIHKYKDRFNRDMVILELDRLYSQASKIRAREFTKMELKPNEAIIVSDGAYMKNACSSAVYYIAADQIMKVASGFLASDETQSVLCSEINGAYTAIKLAVDMHKKTDIKYYYDNTSIINVFKNRKTEYLPEVKTYKEYLVALKDRGINLEFIELHPKTGEDRSIDNKALTFFHNACDKECREMADIWSKRYDTLAIACNKNGVNLSSINQSKPNSKPKGYNSYGSNKGNNYGKKRY